MSMKVFEMYETVDGLSACRRRPIIIDEFRVKTLEGDYKLGKPGDYLIRGVDGYGELYICDKDIFEKTYDFV